MDDLENVDELENEKIEKIEKPVEKIAGKTGEIVKDLVNEMSDVSENVIDEFKEGELDNQKDEQSFNPEIHASKDGKPIYNKDGSLQKKRGRKSGTVIGTGPHKGKVDTSNQSLIAGQMAADTMIGLSITIGGQDFQPQINKNIGLDERTQLRGLFSDYFESKEIVDFPPGIALTIGVLAYYVPRFGQPATANRFKKMGKWIKKKLSRKKADPEPKEKEAEETGADHAA